jgi:curved DNA-binding protein CbpA
MADHYGTLGVALDADRSVIQAAYRRLARLHHPDFGGNPAVMTALNEAWHVLGHAELRAAYDASRGVRRSQSSAAHAAPARAAGAPTTNADAQPPSPAGPIAAAAGRRGTTDTTATVNFGRYTGWTISQLAVHDPDYLEWLARAPIGRTYRQEIYVQLARRPAATRAASAGGTTTMDRPGALRARLGLHRRR